MKISKTKIIILTASLLLTANLVFAQDKLTPFDPGLIKNAATNAGYNVADDVTLAKTVGALVFGFLSFLGVIFTTLMVYGGYRWLTARGNEQNIDDAKKIIRNAITGVAITVAAYGIWKLIEQFILWY